MCVQFNQIRSNVPSTSVPNLNRFLLCAFCVALCFSLVNTSVKKTTKREILDDSVQSYLMQFGYMRPSSDGAFALRTETSVRDALKDLQRFAGLPATGRLDERTARLLKTKRCGMPDKYMNQTSGRRKRYTIQGQKWPYTDLTWRLNEHDLGNLSSYEVRFVISKALEVWSRHSKLTFRERDDDRADIQIHFYRRGHGDSFDFDGKGVILAHAFFPNNGRSIDIHFDADESWTTSGNTEQGTDLFNVAAHEFGHSLGLSHSDREDALMYPFYTNQVDGFNYNLPEDDRLAIQYLYGAREERQWERIPPYRPAPTRRPTTTTTTTTTTQPPIRTYTRLPPHVGYDPRYPHGRHPYNTRRPDKPHYGHKQPMHPDKKHYKHHKYPTRNYPVTSTSTSSPVYPTARRTNYPAKESPTYRPPPDTCDTSYDAVAVIRREVFIFKDAYFWRINDNGLMAGYPAEITRLWRGLPSNLSHVDAVYERPDAEKKIVFFIGQNYYVLNGNRVERGPIPLTHLGLPTSIKRIDGAMVWGHNGKTYFYSGDKYWRFDEEIQKVELDYPRHMAMWNGVGIDIDAVFQWKDGRTYFFKDKHFWKFNDGHMRIEPGYPRSSAHFWMGCTNNIEENDIAEKLPFTTTSMASTMPSFSLLVIFIHFLYRLL